MLSIRGIDVAYGRIQALFDVSMQVSRGSLVLLLGHNGAGKTTAVNTVSGLLRPLKGSIEFQGQKIDDLSADQRVKRGIVQVPQGRLLLPGLTVRENLLLGAFTRNDAPEIARDEARMYGLFPILKERQGQMAGSLSGGEQQMLAIARALLSKPRILLLDEPSLGLSPRLVSEVFALIDRLHKESGLTILLVEQKAQMVLHMADYAYILQGGRIAAEGKPERLAENAAVRAAYLGT